MTSTGSALAFLLMATLLNATTKQPEPHKESNGGAEYYCVGDSVTFTYSAPDTSKHKPEAKCCGQDGEVEWTNPEVHYQWKNAGTDMGSDSNTATISMLASNTITVKVWITWTCSPTGKTQDVDVTTGETVFSGPGYKHGDTESGASNIEDPKKDADKVLTNNSVDDVGYRDLEEDDEDLPVTRVVGRYDVIGDRDYTGEGPVSSLDCGVGSTLSSDTPSTVSFGISGSFKAVSAGFSWSLPYTSEGASITLEKHKKFYYKKYSKKITVKTGRWQTGATWQKGYATDNGFFFEKDGETTHDCAGVTFSLSGTLPDSGKFYKTKPVECCPDKSDEA